jgi:hypothetical protein
MYLKLVTDTFFRPGYLDGWTKGPLKKGACHQFHDAEKMAHCSTPACSGLAFGQPLKPAVGGHRLEPRHGL